MESGGLVTVEITKPQKSFFIREISSQYIEITNGYWVMGSINPITQLPFYLSKLTLPLKLEHRYLTCSACYVNQKTPGVRQFCKKVRQLLRRRCEPKSNHLLGSGISDKMIVNLNVLGSLMEYKILSNVDSKLVINAQTWVQAI